MHVRIIKESIKDLKNDYKEKEKIEKEKIDLRPFIKHCLSDAEFWQCGGIPTKEKYYINKLNMTEEQLHIFYEAMCSLQQLAKELKKDN